MQDRLAQLGLRARGESLRNQQLPVRSTEAEVTQVEAEAEALGINSSELIRLKAMSRVDSPV